MRIGKWIESVLHPEANNLREGAKGDILSALADQGVRQHWMDTLIEELKDLNLKMDRYMGEEIEQEWRKVSARRNAIVFCLNQILDSKTALETRRFESERDNLGLSSQFEGVAVQRD